jgi:hypothetical protein
MLSLGERASVLRETSDSVTAHAREWVSAAMRAKGYESATPAGEEWSGGPYAVVANLPTLAATLDAVDLGHSPLDGLSVGAAPDERITFRIAPANLKERAVFSGFSADVWLASGVTVEQARAASRHAVLRKPVTIGVVLGAGNIASIGPLDALYELVAHHRVSVLKLNPTFDALQQAYERCLRPLIDIGVLRIVTGGRDVGEYFVGHDDITHVHVTGSAETHDAIAWGVGPESHRQRRRTLRS